MAKKVKKKKSSAKKDGVWKGPGKGKLSRFPPGVSGNPYGRPKGSTSAFSMEALVRATKNVEKRKKKKILEHFVEQAFKDNAVLIALMRKFAPDLKSIEGVMTTFESSMDDDLAKSIQDKLRKRLNNKYP